LFQLKLRYSLATSKWSTNAFGSLRF